MDRSSSLLKGYGGSVFIAISVISILLVMVFPLPGQFLDFLLTFNITFAIVILLLSIYVSKPLDLYIFPSLLLITTLYRLALNLASTRLILSNASYTDPKTGLSVPNLRAAGDVIKVFGELVGGDNAVVGFIIFVILVTIQYIVITNGAQRVAEVRARFTLDAMPGKQMAIDADLNAGLIDETQARQRRMDIEAEQDFYGAMDGASKFVKGDAIAAIIIVIINILGGIVVGVVQKGLPFTEAVKTYTILTVGDGLVSQIPALVISTATGLVITRASSDEDLGQDVTRQLLSQPKALVVAAITLFALLVISPLPRVPLVLGIITLMVLAVYLLNKERLEDVQEMGEERPESLDQEMLQTPEVDPVLVKIGYGLIPFVDEEQGGDLLDRVPKLRTRLVNDLGFPVPLIRVRDDLLLGATKYVIELWGVMVAEGELVPGHMMALSPSGMTRRTIEGIETIEPIYGHPALWILEANQQDARDAGYATVVSPDDVLITHLEDVIKRNAADLLSLQITQELVDAQREINPAAVEAVVSERALTIVDVQKVLKLLLEEQVPIRNLQIVLETLADYGRESKEAADLATSVRQVLRREITSQYLTEEGGLAVVMLSPALQQLLSQVIQSNEAVDPSVIQRMLENLSQQIQEASDRGIRPVVLVCPGAIRYALRNMITSSLPSLPVLAYEEMAPKVAWETVGIVDANPPTDSN
ncbi:EscV/YscV/HrcV family type III secretion system export apparatus protein [Candidatus Poribacteria bacterium]|nr:EscV/YscV/HrcV family type III secretion system export apparatus protein [Candidatus Poribacteria bacterium]